jgi:putative flippase GtrA
MTSVREAVPVRRGGLAGQVGRFAVIGALSTVLHLGLFALLVRAGMGSQLANGSALVIATIANTAANRAWTFGVTGRERMVAHHGQALMVFGITYAATTLALAIQHWIAPDAGTLAQTAVVAVANVLSRCCVSLRCGAGSSPLDREVTGQFTAPVSGVPVTWVGHAGGMTSKGRLRWPIPRA